MRTLRKRYAGRLGVFALAPAFTAACSHVPAPQAHDEPNPKGTTAELADSTGTVVPDRDVMSSTGDVEGAVLVRGATLVGRGRIDFVFAEGRIAEIGAVGETLDGGDRTVLDLAGRFVAPAFIDSHVHLAYAFDAPTLARGGVAAAVDLAAPLDFLGEAHAPLQLLAAGPMITAIGGYPTQGWGAGGFGLEVDGATAVRDAVERVIGAGAGVIKVPLDHAPALDRAELDTLVQTAHGRGVKVVAHALGDSDARLAAEIGADVLAHTPTEALSDATIEAWSTRTVISTLDAFGGDTPTLENLARLRAAGASVVYGTDLGNTGIPAIDRNELELLMRIGMDGDAILAAATASPAKLWGFDELGSLDVGKRASFLVLAADPRIEPLSLTEPEAVYIDGELQPPSVVGGSDIAD